MITIFINIIIILIAVIVVVVIIIISVLAALRRRSIDGCNGKLDVPHTVVPWPEPGRLRGVSGYRTVFEPAV